MQRPAIAANYDGKRGLYYYTTNYDFKLLPFNIKTKLVDFHHCQLLQQTAIAANYDGKRGLYYYTTDFDYKLLPLTINHYPRYLHHCQVLLPGALGYLQRSVPCF